MVTGVLQALLQPVRVIPGQALFPPLDRRSPLDPQEALRPFVNTN